MKLPTDPQKWPRWGLLLAVLPLLFAFGPASGQDASGLTGVEMTADRFELAQDGEVLIAQGNVRAAKDGTVVSAERVIAWPKEDEIFAEGNVILTDSGTLIRADKLLYNWKEHRAVALNVELHKVRPDRVLNWHLSAPSIQRRGQDVYEVKRGVVTSCGMARPHQYFSARKIVFRDRHSIEVHHAVYRVHEVPVFYLPYYYRDLAHPWPWYHVGFGRSSDFGEFLLTDLGFEIHPGVDLLFDMDYYSARGPAGGIDLEYENERRIGYLDTYFIEDDGEDFNGTPLLQDDRYRVKFLHRELLTDTDVDSLVVARKQRLAGQREHFFGRWTLDVEYQRFSDKNFYQEFFEGEARTQKEPENRIFMQGLWDNTAVSVLGQTRVNEFLGLGHSEQRTPTGVPGQTEYLPRLRFDLLSEPLWQNRMLLTLESEYARVRRLFDGDTSLSAVDALSNYRDLDRLDFRAELSAPFQVDFLHVEPFVFGRETFYDELLEEERSEWRTVHGAGVRLSTEFWRTFGLSKPEWNIDRLHHVMTPEITFLSVQDTDHEPEELVYFDGVDTERAVEKITFSLRNVVQTKRNDTTVNWLEFEVLADFFTAPERDNGGVAWSDIETDFRWTPHPKLSLFNDNEINTDPARFEIINAGLAYTPRPATVFRLSHRYDREGSSRTIFSTDSQLTEKWGMQFWSDYEWEEDEFYDLRVVVRRMFHCWALEIGYDVDQGRGDHTVFFSIGPRLGSQLLRTGGMSSGALLGRGSAY